MAIERETQTEKSKSTATPDGNTGGQMVDSRYVSAAPSKRKVDLVEWLDAPCERRGGA
jgi:hypothetical protein